jgi:predicted oxidoreductase
MIWSPLAGGRLFQTDASSFERTFRVRKAMQAVATQLGSTVTIDQVAYAWLLNHPARLLPILGTNDMKRIQSAVDALQLKLNRQQWFRIYEASAGCEVP